MGNCCSATDWIQAASSLVIGAAAAVLAWRANSLADAANNLALAGIRPYMLVQTSHGRLYIKVVVKNDGAGPAIIDSVTYSVLLKPPVTDTKAAQDAAPGVRHGLLLYDENGVVPGGFDSALLDTTDPTDCDIGYNIAGDAIGSGKELVLLACKVQDSNAGRTFLNSIRALLDGATIEMTYTDARDGPTAQARQLVHTLSVPFHS